MKHVTTSLKFLFSLATLVASPLAGQASSARTAIAIPDHFPAIDATAVVVREGQRNVILLKAGAASPETLFVALGVLRRARVDRPVPVAGEMIPVLGYAMKTVLKSADRSRLEEVLERLVRAEPLDLGSWGLGRLVRMHED